MKRKKQKVNLSKSDIFWTNEFRKTMQVAVCNSTLANMKRQILFPDKRNLWISLLLLLLIAQDPNLEGALISKAAFSAMVWLKHIFCTDAWVDLVHEWFSFRLWMQLVLKLHLKYYSVQVLVFCREYIGGTVSSWAETFRRGFSKETDLPVAAYPHHNTKTHITQQTLTMFSSSMNGIDQSGGHPSVPVGQTLPSLTTINAYNSAK
jgi:hypothetical protein